MDTERRSLIVTAIVGLLVLAIIIGSIYYLVRFIQGRGQSAQNTQVSTSQQTQSPQASATNTPQTGGSPVPQVSINQNVKVYNGGNFQLPYPNNWGVLTCSNSGNVELDPSNQTDSRVTCDFAVKPVTVMVTDNLTCQGDSVTLGANRVVRSSRGSKGGGEINYRWCVINPNGADLDITHRVSQSGSRATSTNDYSQEIEQMISGINFSQGS